MDLFPVYSNVIDLAHSDTDQSSNNSLPLKLRPITKETMHKKISPQQQTQTITHQPIMSQIYQQNNKLTQQIHALQTTNTSLSHQFTQLLLQKNWYKNKLHQLQSVIKEHIPNNTDYNNVNCTPPFTEITNINTENTLKLNDKISSNSDNSELMINDKQINNIIHSANRNQSNAIKLTIPFPTMNNSNNYNNKYLQPQPHIHPNNCLVTNVNILPLKQNINNNYSFMNGNNTTINQRNSNKNQHTKTKVKSTNKSRKAFEPGHPKFERALQQLIEMRQKHAQGLLPSVRQFMKTIHMGFPNTNAVLKYYSNNYLNMTLDDFKRDYMVIGRVIGRPKKTNRYDYYDTSDSDTDSDSPQTNGCNNNNNNNNNSNLKTEEENSDVEMSLKCQNKNTGGTI